MGHRRSRLRRTLARLAGVIVELPQRDGSTRSFPAKTFWHQLMLDQIDAACGVVPDSPVAQALEGATPEARAKIERVVESGQAGDFMRGGNGEDEPGLLEVAEPVENLSEQG